METLKKGVRMNKLAGNIEYSRFIIPYRVYGCGDKTIVCLSGAKQTMSAWRSFISHFNKDYRIVVFDMPGQGRSQIMSGDLGVTLQEQVDVLNYVVKFTKTDTAKQKYIIGGSWGSIVAAAYVDKYPGIFDRVILGSFGTKANMVLNSIISQVQEYISEDRGREIAPLMIEKFGQYIPDSLKRQIVSQFDSMSDNQFQSFYEHSVSVTKMGDLKQHINLSRIDVPVLVVMGQYDTIMDLFDTKKSAQLLPYGEFRLIKGVGHFLHWEQPEVLSVYEDFFSAELIAGNAYSSEHKFCS